VQITMAEDIGIGGRAGYYDGIGAARDVIQNHLLQLLALTAMEEPASFDADALAAEKTKVLGAVRLPKDLGRDTVRGQYAAGWQGGAKAVGYLEEEGIDASSKTDTYAAIRLGIDNRRWAGVPFYLRTGKRLGRRVTEIAVVFQRAPHSPFDAGATEGRVLVRVHRDDDYLDIDVDDNGRGMAEGSIGNGLGTQIVRTLVEGELGGSITWDSTPGEGTRVRIRVPKRWGVIEG